jgi:hypothetical protein
MLFDVVRAYHFCRSQQRIAAVGTANLAMLRAILLAARFCKRVPVAAHIFARCESAVESVPYVSVPLVCAMFASSPCSSSQCTV